MLACDLNLVVIRQEFYSSSETSRACNLEKGHDTIRVALIPGRNIHASISLGRGAMVAQRTLNPYILVRIRAPQPVVGSFKRASHHLSAGDEGARFCPER